MASLIRINPSEFVPDSQGDTAFSPRVEQMLDAMPAVESSGNPRAVSPKGARGLYQIMPATARQYGVDPKDLFDPKIGRHTAGRILTDLMTRYQGNAHKTLAAYNAGPGRVDSGRQLPQETRSYLSRFMSVFTPAEASAAEGPLSVPRRMTIDPKDFAPAAKSSTPARMTIDPKDFLATGTGVPSKQPELSQGMSPEQLQQQLQTVQGGAALGMPIIAAPQVAEPVLRYGVPAAASAAAFAAAPATIPAQALAGGTTSVASDLWDSLVDKMFGIEGTSFSPRQEALSFGAGAVGGAVGPALEMASGLQGARRMATGAAEQATKEAGDLAEKQAQVQQQVTTARRETATQAVQAHEKAVSDINQAVTKNKRLLSQQRAQVMEQARPEIAQRAAGKQIEGMIGKTPAQFRVEEAAPYGQRASALAAAKDPYFDAALRFHQEVGKKFDPYIKPIENHPLKLEVANTLRQDVAGIRSTVNQRGMRLQSADLRDVMRLLGSEPSPGAYANTAVMGGTLDDIRDPNERRIVAQRLGLIVDEGKELTAGQIWGLRARANKVLAESRNPADRWTANQVVEKLTDILPGVPPEIRQQYAFERGLMQDVTRDVAGARTPKEVGDAVFGSGVAEAPLQVVRFTKKYAPEKLGGLKDAFADWYIGNGANPDKVGKLNPAVVRELYGSDSDSVLRLLGPEGSAKERSVGQIIATSPESKAEFQQVWNNEFQKFETEHRAQAITDGKLALQQLGPKYAAVRRALASAKTPEAQLRILQQELPNPHDAAFQSLTKGIPPARMENYMKHRMIFDSIGALSGVGMVARNPSAAIPVGVAIGIRAGVRYALSTPGGAETYLRLLESKNAGRIARGLAGMAVSVATRAVHDQLGQVVNNQVAPAQNN